MSEKTDPLINTVIAGRYRILRPLGEGGMGQVYLAEHQAIQKQVAVKVLRPEYSTKPEIVARFQQEAISASRIKHPNVLDVFDFGQTENGCFFLTMEFLEGNDLAEELVRRRTLDAGRGLKIALQICRALGAAHVRGVVHRDLKPENVFIQRTADGEEIVKIVDFGIAQLRSPEEAAASEPKRRRLTRTGMIFGTPEYMAPEQAGGKNADLRVDIYALGVILYEMFTGAVPFTGETFLQVLSAHLNSAAPAMSAVCPDLKASPELQAAIMRALAKEPTQRYASMADFAQALAATPEGRHFSGTFVRTSTPEFAATYPVSEPSAPAPASLTAAQFSGATGPETARSPGNSALTLSHGSQDGMLPGPRTTAQHTLLTAESSASELPRKAKWPAFAAIAAAALAVLGTASVLVSRSAKHAATPAPSAEPAVTQQPATAPPPVVPLAAQPSASAARDDTPKNVVHLQVESEPPGALLLKNGFQVCDATPCEVLSSINETLELEARKGSLRGQAKVLAQRDQKVKIALAAPVAKPKASNPARLCERFDPNLGIKIMAPCN